MNFLCHDCVSYYEWLRCQFARKRDILAAGLLAAGNLTLTVSPFHKMQWVMHYY
jgi:hypothetical protein